MRKITIPEDQAHRLFFTSDHHFGHTNAIANSERPYESIEDMDADFIRRWNDVVPENGLVVYGGDLTMDSRVEVINYLFKVLNGQVIFFVVGNHDRKYEKYLCRTHKYDKFGDRLLLRVKDKDHPEGVQRIIIDHYPNASWYQMHRGAWHLYGHSHCDMVKNMPKDFFSYHMGVDTNGYKPVSYRKIKRVYEFWIDIRRSNEIIEEGL